MQDLDVLLKQSPKIDMKDFTIAFQQLEHATSAKKFEKIKFNEELSRTLTVAIEFRRDDIVAFLLSVDTHIKEVHREIQSKEEGESKLRIDAFLEFYSYLQKSHLKDDFQPGRSVALLQQAAIEISAHRHLHDCILLIGRTGVGKSTLFNILLKQLYRNDIQADGNFRLVNDGNAEIAKTQSAVQSETTWPKIALLEGRHFLDMPGNRDNRGGAYELVSGLSPLLLEKVCVSFKAILFICTAQDLYDTKGTSILEELNMLGRIFEKTPALRNNLIIIVNKETNDQRLRPEVDYYYTRLTQHLADNLEENARELVRSLNRSQIIGIGIPDHMTRNKILTRIDSIHDSAAFSQFNFTSYHRNVEKFKIFLEHLRAYYVKMQKKVNAYNALLLNYTSDNFLQPILSELPSIESQPRPSDLTICPAECIKLKQEEESLFADNRKILMNIKGMVNDLQKLLDTSKKQLPQEGIELDQPQMTPKVLSNLLKKHRLQCDVIEKFFADIRPLLEILHVPLLYNQQLPKVNLKPVAKPAALAHPKQSIPMSHSHPQQESVAPTRRR